MTNVVFRRPTPKLSIGGMNVGPSFLFERLLDLQGFASITSKLIRPSGKGLLLESLNKWITFVSMFRQLPKVNRRFREYTWNQAMFWDPGHSSVYHTMLKS
jgi:hypothetical protein